ncbi:right-handed parallel beta-helix repeat-containing protein [Rubripirellula amarantea]|uniref:Uncharacterized protein n=1 Tax=Rubripirellula amarantea TaxID=2527999 RepID=A0A5C5WE04_9BACT|nr:right-handed parallel beta-helix repeat-containing protein [Rubripirellula amarantea]MDA8745371.1 right-handed parallel beta-helix repeat-containing protein [Rubripirellula amarantea]TWT49196.1 hypothetical protein Pla22_43880 [Rubripirellula amarantea]
MPRHPSWTQLFRIALLMLIFSVVDRSVHAARYYVGPDGSDSISKNQATNRSTPYRTIQHAVNQADPGDFISVFDGTYNENVYIGRSGTPGNYIRLVAANREGAKVRGWISSNDQSYLLVDGFDVTNTSSIPPTKGVSFNRCHHIKVRDCRIHDCYGGGLAFDRSDSIVAEWNIVHNNAYFNVDQHSGISAYQPQKIGSDNRAWGIIFRNNTSFGNYNFVDNPNFGRPTDGNGIVIDDTRNLQAGGAGDYNRRILVENNWCFDNGGQGIHCFSSRLVYIRNNTCVNNVDSFDFGGEITLSESSQCVVMNNILDAKEGKFSGFQYDSSDVRWQANIFDGPTREITPGVLNIYADPGFIPGTIIPDVGSPAINTATNVKSVFPLDVFGQLRYVGRLDRGAIEAQ